MKNIYMSITKILSIKKLIYTLLIVFSAQLSMAQIEVTKSHCDWGYTTTDKYRIQYNFTFKNTGDDPVSEIQVWDDLGMDFGDDAYIDAIISSGAGVPDMGNPTNMTVSFNGSYNGTTDSTVLNVPFNDVLLPDHTFTFFFCVELNADVIPENSQLTNVVHAQATDTAGLVWFDTASDTEIFNTNEAILSAGLTASTPVLNLDATYDFFYTITLSTENALGTSGGNVTNFQYYDDFNHLYGDGVPINSLSVAQTTGPAVAFNPAFDGGSGLNGGSADLFLPNTTVPLGTSLTYVVTLNVGPAMDFGSKTTEGKVSGYDVNNILVEDLSRNTSVFGHDDKQCGCSPTPVAFPFSIVPTIVKTKISEVVASSGIVGNRDILYRIRVGSSLASNVEMDSLVLVDDLTPLCGGLGIVSIVSPPTQTGGLTQIDPVLNASYDGDGDTDIFDNISGLLDPGDFVVIEYTVEVARPCPGVNEASFSGRNPAQIVTATVTAQSLPLNLPPVAVDDVNVTSYNTAVNVAVLANDSDPENDAITIISIEGTPIVIGGIVTLSDGTTVELLINGELNVTPPTGSVNPINFQYTIADPLFGRDSAEVDITIPFVSTPLIDKTKTGEVVAVSGTVGNRDLTFRIDITNSASSDVELDSLSLIDDLAAMCGGAGVVTVLSMPAITASTASMDPVLNAGYNGVSNVSIFDNISGLLLPGQSITIEFSVEAATPCPGVNEASFSGRNPNQTFTSTVDDDVQSFNAAPVAVDDVDVALYNTPLTVDVLDNDNDPENDLITITHVDGLPIIDGGAAIVLADGTSVQLVLGELVVTAPIGSVDPINFQYTIADDLLGTDVANVSITIPFISTPTIAKSKISEVLATSGTIGNRDVTFRLVIGNSSSSTVEIDSLILADDLSQICGVGLGIVSVIVPPSISASSASIDPVLNGGYDGVGDVDVFDNVSGMLLPGQSVTVEFTVEIATPCNGLNTADFYARNPNQTFTSTVSSSIQTANQPPVAVDDVDSTSYNTSVMVDVLDNDSDPELDPIEITHVNGMPISIGFPVTLPDGTMVDLLITGELDVTPVVGSVFPINFQYSIADPLVGQDVANVTITIPYTSSPTITKTQIAEVAAASLITGNRDVTFRIDIGNDVNSDVELDSLKLVDDLALMCGGSGIVGITTMPAITAFSPGTVIVPNLNGSYNGIGDVNIFDNISGVLLPNESITLTFTVEVATPCPGFNNASFSALNPDQTVTDVAIDSALATNQPPVAVDDEDSTAFDTPILLDVLANDSDPETDPLTITEINGNPISVGFPVTLVGGTIVDLVGGQLLVTPAPGTLSPIAFQYTIADPLGGEDMANVVVYIDNNFPPEAIDDDSTTTQDTPININVIENDTDFEGPIDSTSITIAVAPVNGGMLGVNPDGTVDYTPAPGFVGIDIFSYEVCDMGVPVYCDIAMVTVTIVGTPDTTAVTTPEDVPVTVCTDILTNFAGPIDNVGLCELPANGVVALTGFPNPSCLEYTPNNGYVGPDTMCIVSCAAGICDTTIVTIDVTPVNDAPVALDTTVTTPEDETITICPSFMDEDGIDTLITAVDCGMTTGTATINPNTFCIDYTPATDFVGTDEICYIVCDAAGLCDTATVTVNVTPVTDTISVTVPEDSMITVCTDIETNFADPIDAVSLCEAPMNGTVVLTGLPNASCLEYSPNADYVGPDTMCVVSCAAGVCDTTIVLIEVTPVNDPPVAKDDTEATTEETLVVIDLVNNDTDPDGLIDSATVAEVTAPINGGSLVFNTDGTVDYTPATDFVGVDVFTYEVCDNGMPVLCDTAMVEVTVNPVTDTTSVTVPEDSVITICTDIETNFADPIDAVSLCEAPMNGTVVLTGLPNASCLEYSPNADYVGPDTMCVVSCAAGVCDTTIVLIEVTPVNDPPVALDDTEVTTEETLVVIDLVNNDTDPDGLIDSTTVAEVTAPINGGSLVFNPDGTVDYTPATDFVGVDVFTYEVCDNGMPVLCDTAMVEVTVNPVTDTTSVTVPEDSVITICTDIETNFADPIDAVSLCEAPMNGTVVLTGLPNASCLEYSPNADYVGPDTMCVVSCAAGVCDTTIVLIEVTPVNDPPVALDDTEVTTEETLVVIDLVNNDTDPDGLIDSATVAEVTAPVNGGSLVFNPDGTVDYTPATDFVGVDVFTYEVCDNGMPVLCDTAMVEVTVNPVTDTTSVTVPEDSVITICTDIETNFADPIDAISICEAPMNGTLVLTGLPNVSCLEYSPNADYVGPDTMCVVSCAAGVCDTTIVLIEVTPVNDPPVALDDTEVTTEETLVVIDLVNNDTDPDGLIDSATVAEVTAPVNGGSLVFNPDGTVDYTPATDFVGVDVFTYEVCDNGMPVLCDTAMVEVTVNPVTDTTSVTVPEDSVITICTDIETNFADPIDAVSLCEAPMNGTVVLTGLPNASCLEYSPNADYVGPDTMCVVSCAAGVCDTTIVLIEVTPVNDPPVALDDTEVTTEETLVVIDLVNNDTDPDGLIDSATVAEVTAPVNGGSLVFNPDGTVDYTPATDFVGVDVFTYEICDNGMPVLCDTAMVEVTVNPVTDTTSVTVPEDSVITICTDIETNFADPIDAVSLCEAPMNGTVVLTGLPNASCLEYSPNADYVGPDTMCVVSCAAGVCDTTIVLIEVTPVNDPPVALDDTEVTTEETLVVIDLVNNDTDPDGLIDSATVAEVTAPVNGGSLVFNPDGTVDYTPATDFVGVDVFTYEVCDNGMPVLCDTAMVEVTVNPVTDTTSVTVPEDSVITICTDIETNFADPIDAVSLCEAPMNGTVVLTGLPNASCLEYSPNADYVGPDTMCVVSCAAGVCDTTIVLIEVTPVNDPPVALDDTEVTTEETLVVIDLVNNDTDPDGLIDSATVAEVTAPINGGSLVFNPDGTVDYTPATDFVGVDVFTYEVCDNGVPMPVLCDTAMVEVTVNPVTDTTSVTVPEDSVITICTDIETNFADPIDAISICEAPMNGTLVLTGLPNVSCLEYSPNADYVGPDTMCVVSCAAGVCDTTIVLIEVTPVNDPPVALDDTEVTTEETLVVIDLVNNDTDPDGLIDSATVAEVTAPINGGSLVFNPDGTVDYTPATDFVGVDVFTYEVCDNGMPVLCDTAMVEITVNPVTDTTSVTVPEDSVITICTDIETNFADPIDAISICEAPMNGTLVLTGLPNVSCLEYSPNADYVGPDTICVVSCAAGVCDTTIVLIDVTPVNDPPIATDDVAEGLEDETTTIDLVNNDTDPDGLIDSTTVAEVTAPINGGTLVFNTDGTVDYTPATDFVGVDVFTYEVCDNGVPMPVLCDTAMVEITVNPVTDTTSVTVPEDSVITICTDIETNFADPIDAISICEAPMNGTLVLTGLPNASCLEYSPNADYVGPDTMCVVSCAAGVCDTTIVLIDVTPVNDPPIATDDVAEGLEDETTTIDLVNNDTDPDGLIDSTTVAEVTAPINGGTLVFNTDGTVDYTPATDFVGVDVFTYEVCDNGVPMPVLCDTAMVEITVNPVTDTTSVTVPEDSVISICTDVETNFADPIDNVSLCEAPMNGSVVLTGLSNVSCLEYSPSTDYYGPDTMCVITCAAGVCDTTIVLIDVTPVNDPPVIVDDAATTMEDTDVTIDVLDNDSDIEGPLDTASVAIVDSTSNGTVTVLPNGEVVFEPDTNFVGLDTFTYVVCDSGFPIPTICDTAEVIITILPVNDPPIAINDTTSTLEDTDVIVQVVSTNDTDVDGNLDTNIDLDLTVLGVQSSVSTPNGTYENDGNGNVTFSPVLNWNGLDSTQYVVCDDGTPLPSLCDTAWIYVDVIPVNDPPVIVDDAATTLEDTDVTIDVLVNDSDIEGPLDSTSVMIVDSTSNGIVTVNPITGVVTFEPDTNFYGLDTFTYSVCDNGTPLPVICDTAEVIITVLPVNDPPIAVNDLDTTFEEIPTGPIVVVANDSDVDGNIVPNSVDFDLDPTNPGIDNQETTPEGVWSIDFAGNVIFTPTLNFNGTVTLDYLVCDDGTPLPSLCDTATITVVVMPVNDAPVALNDVDTVVEDQIGGINVDVVANDSDPFDPFGNIDSATVTVIIAPMNGTTGIPTVTGEVPYIPNPHFNGVDSFQYSVCDDGNPLPALCDTAWAVITVLPENDPPVAIDDTTQTVENTPVVINVISNDNPDSDPLDPLGNIDSTTVGEITPPMDGTISINPITGEITYTPNPGFFGTDEFEYVVCDDGNPLPSECDTALVTVTVLVDSDDDGIPNDVNPWFQDDIDDDNDGIMDIVEGNMDSDGDGITDDLDLDSDQDGIPDNVEAQTTDGYIEPLYNPDGTILDIDGDGLNDAYDESSSVTPSFSEGLTPIDTDGDTEFDYLDSDSDNDGVEDIIEGNDADHDGIADIVLSGLDSDDDGLDDAFDSDNTSYNDPSGILVDEFPGDNGTMPNTDGTEDLDYRDTDDDGDGVETIVETGIYEDCDNDGVPNYLDPDVCIPIIPEGISPNGDGLNDAWVIEGIEYYPNHEVWIFNRWGHKVYESNDYKNDWRGTNNFGLAVANKNLPEGTYFYILETGIEGQAPLKGFIYVTR